MCALDHGSLAGSYHENTFTYFRGTELNSTGSIQGRYSGDTKTTALQADLWRVIM